MAWRGRDLDRTFSRRRGSDVFFGFLELHNEELAVGVRRRLYPGCPLCAQWILGHCRQPRSSELTVSLLEIRNLTKRFGHLAAVRDLNLTIPAGERHAIIGSNGAGKTSLFNMISGRLR